MVAAARCSVVVLVMCGLVSVAVAGGSVYVDPSGEPTDPPTIVAEYSEVEIEGGVSETYDGFGVEASAGYYLCNANFLGLAQEDGGHYVWSKSLNWDSVGITVLHVKRVHTIITNPGSWLDLMHGDTEEECGLADITEAGPTEQHGSVDVGDIPVIPGGTASLGTDFRFNVAIDAPEKILMNQHATIEHLAITNPETKLTNCNGDPFTIRRGLENAGMIYGNPDEGYDDLFVGVSGGIDNTGVIEGQLGTVTGGITNGTDGVIRCYGADIAGWIENDGEMYVRGKTTIDAPAIEGNGFIDASAELTLANSEDPDAGCVMRQDLNSQTALLSAHPIQTADGATISAKGRMDCVLDGDLRVTGAETLTIWGGGTTQCGHIDVPSDATLRTWDQAFEFHHAGTITVDGRLLTPTPPRDMDRFSGTIVNDGQIVVRNGGTLEMPKVRYSSVYKSAVLNGSGLLRVEFGGDLVNPRTAGDQTIELAFGATATFDSHCIDNFDRYYNTLVGHVENAGRIQVTDGANGAIRGTLVNDNEIRVFGGELVINVPEVAGTGDIALDGGTLEFRHTADPDTPPVLKQPVSGHGKLIARSGLAADGASVTMHGHFYGNLGCELDVTTGQTLYYGDLNSDGDEIVSDGIVRAFGADTRMHLNKLTNKGLIEAGDGGVLWTYDHELTNEGTIHVQDGGTFKVRLNRFADDHYLFANHGTIRVDGALLEFPGGRRYLAGTGDVIVENGGVVTDPQVRPWDTGNGTAYTPMTLDATSRIECEVSATAQLSDVEQHGHLQLAEYASIVFFGDWHMTPTASIDSGEGWGRRYIKLHGDWINEMTDGDNFSLGYTTVQICAGTPENPLRIEVASADLGDTPTGWDGNFCLQRLEVLANNHVRLVDGRASDHEPLMMATSMMADYTPMDAGEQGALYVEDLLLHDGAILDTGNLNVYYNSLSGDPSQIVPEPATVALLAFGGLGLLLRRSRR